MVLQLNTLLDKAKKIDPEMPVKLIVKISQYDRKIIKRMQDEGFELEFEMPLQSKICGNIPANRGKILRQLSKEGKVEEIEICGLSAVETM